jgi:trigger factor
VFLCSLDKVWPYGRYGPYDLVRRETGTGNIRDRTRDSRSTHGLTRLGRAVAARTVHRSELGPGYCLLYSPVGKLPVSFRSIEAAASGGPLAFLVDPPEPAHRIVDPPDAIDRGHARVKLTMERLPESRVQLEITAEEEESTEAMRRAVRKVGNQITLPGFRKGKAPKAMIEQMYGPEVFLEEANRFLMSDLYRQALEREDLVPVGDPSVDISSSEPLSFTVVVPVYPEIDPGAYQDVRIEPIDAAVDDAAVDELVEALRKSHSPWIDPQGEGLQVGAGLELTPKSRLPRDGDQVTIDYTVQEEGANVEEPVVDAVFVLGESGLLEPIEDAIKGLRVGETTGFSVPFGEDDTSIDESLRGKTLSYSVTLKGLKERDLLPLDDDFAKTAGDVDTLDELRSNLREELHQTRTAEARREALAQIIRKIAEGAAIDLPGPMIDRAVEDDLRRLRGRLAQQGVPLEAYLRAVDQTEEALREEMRPAAEERLRNSLLLRSIAEREGIAVGDDDVDAAVERISLAAQTSEQPQQAEAFARSDYVRGMLQSELFEQQLTNRLVEIATEGQGAVVNAWLAPVSEPSESTAAGEETPGEAEDRSEGEADETVDEGEARREEA